MKSLIVCVFLLSLVGTALSTDDLVAVPGRGFVPRGCVHSVPDGATITRLPTGDYMVSHLEQNLKYIVEAAHDECPGLTEQKQQSASAAAAAPFQGWQAYVQDLTRSTYDVFLGGWNVPAAPANPDTNSVIFYFTGLQDSGSGAAIIDIIQPVLQFGDKSAAGGCLCWAIASWYVPSKGRSFVSSLKQVQAGDNIFGNMTQTGSNCWYISTAVVGTSTLTALNVCESTLVDQPAAFVTEEAYAVTCNDYPAASAPLVFQNLQLFKSGQQVSPVWTSQYNTPNCNSKVATSNSGATVTFTSNN